MNQQIIGKLKDSLEIQILDSHFDQASFMTPEEIKRRAPEIQKVVKLLNKFDEKRLSFVQLITKRVITILELALQVPERQDSYKSNESRQFKTNEVLQNGLSVIQEMRIQECKELRRLDICRALDEVNSLTKALESIGETLRIPDAVVDLFTALFNATPVLIGEVYIDTLNERFTDDNSLDKLSDEQILALVELESVLCGETRVPQALIYHAFDRLIK